MKLNFSGRIYNAVSYGVDPETFEVDYDDIRAKAIEHQPKVLIAGWSAYPRQLDFAKFREIADEVGAMLWVDMAHFAGLVAAGLHPSPLPHAHVVSSTVHKTLAGPRSGIILSNEESLFKKLNSAVFPGQQGGPLMHVIAAKATAFLLAATPEFKDRQERTSVARRRWPTGSRGTTPRPRASTSSRVAPTCTWCSSTCASPRSTASRPRTSCTRSASP